MLIGVEALVGSEAPGGAEVLVGFVLALRSSLILIS